MGMGEALMAAAGGRWGPAPCGRAGMVLPSQPAGRPPGAPQSRFKETTGQVSPSLPTESHNSH